MPTLTLGSLQNDARKVNATRIPEMLEFNDLNNIFDPHQTAQNSTEQSPTNGQTNKTFHLAGMLGSAW